MQRFPAYEDVSNVKEVSRKYILQGLAPQKPFLSRSETISTTGSDFTRVFNAGLAESGIKSVHLEYDESLNTPIMTNTLIERSLRETEEGSFGDSLRRNRLSLITLGVAVTSYDAEGNLVTEPNLGGNSEAPGTTGLLTAEHIAQATAATITQIRGANPDSVIVLMESPLPLKSFAGRQSIFSIDCASKSVLRVGTQFLLWSAIPNIYYFPAYEIVRWLSPHVAPVFGVGDALDNRHISSDMIRTVADLFVETYFLPAE